MYIEFSTDTKNNTTVILAKNSTGKTTLMQAINWCLYGDDYVNLDNKRKLLNSVVKDLTNKQNEIIIVEVGLEENGLLHHIKRERIVTVSKENVVSETLTLSYKDSNGETINIIADATRDNSDLGKINRMINMILSKQMAQYFLFDGERIDELGSNSSQSKKDIKQAIGAVNGFNILENSVESLQQLKKLLSRLFTVKVNNKELKGLQQEIDNLHSNINTLTNSIEDNKVKIYENEEAIDDLNRLLQSSDEVKELAKTQKNLERKENNTQKRIREKDKQILQQHNKYRHASILAKLQHKYSKIDFEEDAEEKTIPNMEVSSIDAILDRGICICGEVITPEHEHHLVTQRNYQPPISNSQLIASFNTDIRGEVIGINTTVSALNDSFSFRHEYREELSYIEEQLQDIAHKIGNADSESVKSNNEKRQILKDETDNLRTMTAVSEANLINSNKELELKEKQYNTLYKEQNKYDFEKIRIDLVTESLQMIEEYNESLRQERKNDIEKLANKHFNEIIYKSKKIVINDKFEYSVFEENGTPASPSEGERIAISMSLILAIIDAHKAVFNENKEKTDAKLSYVTKREFALVMDAAFAKLDKHFSKTIAEKLPRSVEQIVLFSTEKQYEGSVQEGLSDSIGKLYVIELPDDESNNALTTDNLIQKM